MKKKIITESKRFDFDFTSKKIALSHFIDWCSQIVPIDAFDVTIELIEEWEYDDCFPAIEIAWKR